MVEKEDKEDLLETLLKNLEGSQESLPYQSSQTVSGIDKKLYEFRSIQTINRKDSLMEFWENHKYEIPELYKFAVIFHSVPMTQISCERLFSSMKFIYLDKRGNFVTRTV